MIFTRPLESIKPLKSELNRRLFDLQSKALPAELFREYAVDESTAKGVFMHSLPHALRQQQHTQTESARGRTRTYKSQFWRLVDCHRHTRKTEQFKVCKAGFEPATAGLEGRCSIQLSYSHILFKVDMEGFEPPYFLLLILILSVRCESFCR